MSQLKPFSEHDSYRYINSQQQANVYKPGTHIYIIVILLDVSWMIIVSHFYFTCAQKC